jgi:hypothetical protein
VTYGPPTHASLSSIGTSRLRAGLKAGAIAGALSGALSTTHALATGRSPFDAVRAAGTLLLPDEGPPRELLVAGVAAHSAISLAWGLVLALLLPRRRSALWGALAGLVIAVLDLGILGHRWPRIQALPRAPQIADHVAFGAVVGAVLSRTTARR